MDPIADMLIRVKNSAVVGKNAVEIPYSKIKFSIAKLLESQGVLEDVSRQGRKTKKLIKAKIAYNANGEPRFSFVKRVSKPSRRVYVDVRNLKRGSGLGFRVLSTPRGILLEKDAKKNNVGGEVLFEIR